MRIRPKEILEGWRNSLIPPSDLRELIEDVSKERLSKCKNCPFNSTCGEITNFSYCKACGCQLKAKSKCLSCTCGIKDYNAKNPLNPLPIQWEAVTSEEERFAIEEQIKKHEEDQLQTGGN